MEAVKCPYPARAQRVFESPGGEKRAKSGDIRPDYIVEAL